METAGLLKVDLVSADRPPPVPLCDCNHLALTDDQQDAAQQLRDAIGQGFRVNLLDGVTGSGKTEVYFEAVEATIKAGKQVLILLPEIAIFGMASPFCRPFRCCASGVAFGYSPGQKRKSWRFYSARTRIGCGWCTFRVISPIFQTWPYHC